MDPRVYASSIDSALLTRDQQLERQKASRRLFNRITATAFRERIEDLTPCERSGIHLCPTPEWEPCLYTSPFDLAFQPKMTMLLPSSTTTTTTQSITPSLVTPSSPSLVTPSSPSLVTPSSPSLVTPSSPSLVTPSSPSLVTPSSPSFVTPSSPTLVTPSLVTPIKLKGSYVFLGVVFTSLLLLASSVISYFLRRRRSLEQLKQLWWEEESFAETTSAKRSNKRRSKQILSSSPPKHFRDRCVEFLQRIYINILAREKNAEPDEELHRFTLDDRRSTAEDSTVVRVPFKLSHIEPIVLLRDATICVTSQTDEVSFTEKATQTPLPPTVDVAATQTQPVHTDNAASQTEIILKASGIQTADEDKLQRGVQTHKVKLVAASVQTPAAIRRRKVVATKHSHTKRLRKLSKWRLFNSPRTSESTSKPSGLLLDVPSFIPELSPPPGFEDWMRIKL